MESITMQRMLEIQKELQDKYHWCDMIPENGHRSVLWGVGEFGEIIDIIKKCGDDAIMNDPETRTEFIREIVDVMMYLMDTSLCYNITAEEISKVYEEKHAYNMTRWD